jgi:hypothetical protein
LLISPIYVRHTDEKRRIEKKREKKRKEKNKEKNRKK